MNKKELSDLLEVGVYSRAAPTFKDVKIFPHHAFRTLPEPKAIFVNERQEYIFYLVDMEGEQRANKLGLKDEYYGDAAQATQWYERVLKIIEPLDDLRSFAAMTILEDLYYNAIDDFVTDLVSNK